MPPAIKNMTVASWIQIGTAIFMILSGIISAVASVTTRTVVVEQIRTDVTEIKKVVEDHSKQLSDHERRLYHQERK